MEDQEFSSHENEVVDFEITIVQSKKEHLKKQIERIAYNNDEYDIKVFNALSKRIGREVNKDNIKNVTVDVSVWGQVLDEVYSYSDELIKPSHRLGEYSLVTRDPELANHIPAKQTGTIFDHLQNESACRAFEIVREYTSENTRIAHMGDLVYWQAWLGALNHDFNQPITEQDLQIFIVQHSEGIDPEIDNKLIAQKYKLKKGPHKLATIKRRVGSLSVFLDLNKMPNPCRNQEITMLFQKLTKMYGSSKPAGKAITRHILDDMLDMCGDKLIDIRDRALLLFAWGSGGRRRSEVTAAEMKDLVKNDDGSYTYTIPRSKTDQQGKGYPVPVKGRVAQALEIWLTKAGIVEGHIFRSIAKTGKVGEKLSSIDVNRIVKRRLQLAGYNEDLFTAHSLRSGWISQAGMKGKPLGDVMQMTTHRSVATVMRYYQAGNINNNSAADLAD